MKRRAALVALPAGLFTASVYAAGQLQSWNSRRDHVLLLLELRGGNDGLNTLAPARNPLYRQARPTLALRDGLALTPELFMHPALAPLLPLWQQKRLGFALGVGWSPPSRSHFKASDQWAVGDPSGMGSGWLARAFRTSGPLLALGGSGCPAMEGGTPLALQLSPAQLNGRREHLFDPSQTSSPMLRQALALERSAQQELQIIREALRPLPARGRVAPSSDVPIPRTALGRQVELALRLIGSGVCPPVLQLAQGGYDTHANQEGRHARVLRQLAEALVALDVGLQMMRLRPRVTLLAVSEFGRRLQQNGSGGTDHGSASIALVYGDAPPHPFIGEYPRLDQLDQRGDLIPGLSPVQLYSQILQPIGLQI